MMTGLSAIGLRCVIGLSAVFCAAYAGAAQITSDPFLFGVLGSPMQYQITADNQPTSFDAFNLPPGLTCNRTTGLISGVPNISGGGYYTKVVAHGAAGDAQADCAVGIQRPVPNPDPVSLATPAQLTRLIGDPTRQRLYGLTPDALVVFDANTLQEIKSFPQASQPVDLFLSGDNRTLWISRNTLTTSVARLDLDLLDRIVEIFPADRVYDPQEGLDDRLYVAGGAREILQLNARTGAIEQRFTPGAQFSNHPTYPTLVISPDRKTLFVSDLYYPENSAPRVGLSRYDVSSTVPVLLQRLEMPATIGRVTPDLSGDWLFYSQSFSGLGSGKTHKTMCVSTHDLTVVRGALSYQGTPGRMVMSPEGQTIIQAKELSNGSQWSSGVVDLFDAHSFQLKRSIVVANLFSIGGGGTIPMTGVATDSTASNIVAAVFVYPYQLRKYDLTPAPAPPTPERSMLNISTRLLTQNGDSASIGGFIVAGAGAKTVAGSEAKTVMLRGVGTSLAFDGQLEDPVLELHRSDGTIIAENDNWNSDRQGVMATGLAPVDERESAMIVSLQPGAYTVVLHGAAGTSGIGVVEAYDLTPSDWRLANISTRGRVETGDDVMIAGFILGGADLSSRVVVRGVGPSLAQAGVPGALVDPVLELYNGNGVQFAANDNWRDTQQADLQASGLAPNDNAEAAFIGSLAPGAYTAILRGKNNTTGIGLIEVYNLQ